MFRKHCNSWYLLCALIGLAFQVRTVAVDSTPRVTAADSAARNGAAVTVGALLQSGDRLTTDDGGTLAMEGRLGIATFGHRTQARIAPETLTLSSGWVQITGRWPVRAGFTLLEPRTSETRFEVVQLPTGVGYLHVLNGIVDLHGAAGVRAVRAGEAMRFQQEAAAAASPAAAPQTATGAGAGQAGSAAGTTAGGAGAAGGSAAGTAAGAAAGAASGAAAVGSGVAAAAGLTTEVTVGAVAAAAVAAGFVYHQVTTPSSPS